MRYYIGFAVLALAALAIWVGYGIYNSKKNDDSEIFFGKIVEDMSDDRIRFKFTDDNGAPYIVGCASGMGFVSTDSSIDEVPAPGTNVMIMGHKTNNESIGAESVFDMDKGVWFDIYTLSFPNYEYKKHLNSLRKR